MRGTAIWCVAVLVLAACDGGVIDHVDAVRKNGRRLAHEGLRLPTEGGSTVRSIAPALRQDPHGRALLDLGQRAVPDLRKLLKDPERRELAAALLAEIGGTEAATELLARWRGMRDDAREVHFYRLYLGSSLPIGYRCENVDQQFYAELVLGLGYAGSPVSGEIAKDTESAIKESERLEAAGEEITFREERDEDGRQLEVRWDAAPVETAREGLRIVVMASAPEAPYLCDLALRSRVRALRIAAAQMTPYLGKDAVQMLPALARLLDDVDLRHEALEPVALLLDGSPPDLNLSGEQQGALVARYKARLRESGQLR